MLDLQNREKIIISHWSGNGTIFLNDQNGVEVNITGPIGWVGILSQMSGYIS